MPDQLAPSDRAMTRWAGRALADYVALAGVLLVMAGAWIASRRES